MKFFLIFLIFFIISCNNKRHEIIVDNYYVDKLGDSNNFWLFYATDKNFEAGEGIIGNLTSIGYNDEYLIVKDYVDSYYVIRRKQNEQYFDKKNLFGPFSKAEFEKFKIRYNIEVDFTRNW